MLLILIAAFLAIIWRFLVPGLLSILIVVICNPIYKMSLKWVRQRRYIAAFLATLFVLLCVILPLGVIVGVVVSNAVELVGDITAQLEAGQLAQKVDQANIWMTTKIKEISSMLPADFDLRASLLSTFKTVGKIAYQYSPKVLGATINVASGLLLLVLFVFVLFAEGQQLFQSIFSLIPLTEEHKNILTGEIQAVISGTFLAMIATAIAQGLLIGIGFWIAGISNAFLWGLVAVGVTLIPMIGAVIMYLPASAFLFMTGHWVAGLFMLIYGVGIISTVDNVIKPLIMRGKVKVHPLLLALSIIGGGLWLGAAGIILGPLVVVLMLAMLKIYQREFA